MMIDKLNELQDRIEDCQHHVEALDYLQTESDDDLNGQHAVTAIYSVIKVLGQNLTSIYEDIVKLKSGIKLAA